MPLNPYLHDYSGVCNHLSPAHGMMSALAVGVLATSIAVAFAPINALLQSHAFEPVNATTASVADTAREASGGRELVRGGREGSRPKMAYQVAGAGSNACGTVGRNNFAGCYYDGGSFNVAKLARVDAYPLAFNWRLSSPAIELPRDHFSVRWEGDFDFAPGTYTFSMTGDDGIRLWVDGEPIIDKWHVQQATSYWAQKTMTAGTHRVKAEYFELVGEATVSLSWSLSASSPTATPALSSAGPTSSAGKYLILHDMAYHLVTPQYLVNHKAYLDTLPVDGVAISVVDNAGVNFTFDIFRPRPYSTAAISRAFDPMRGWRGGNLQHNLALLYTAEPTDIFDDAAWNVIAQNAANFAEAARLAGMEGIFIDNENYFGHGDWKPGGGSCDANRYTLQTCMTKMRERGRQIMQAFQSRFPNLVVMFFHDAYTSDRAFFDRHPRIANVNWENELIGPFVVGFVEAKQEGAQVVQGGSSPPRPSTAELAELYQYARHNLAQDAYVTPACSDAVNISCAAGANGFIPPALRLVWSSRVNGSREIRAHDFMDAVGNPTPDFADALSAAIQVSDRYAWIYTDTGLPDQSSLLLPPGSHPQAVTHSLFDAIKRARGIP